MAGCSAEMLPSPSPAVKRQRLPWRHYRAPHLLHPGPICWHHSLVYCVLDVHAYRHHSCDDQPVRAFDGSILCMSTWGQYCHRHTFEHQCCLLQLRTSESCRVRLSRVWCQIPGCDLQNSTYVLPLLALAGLIMSLMIG